MPLAPLMASVFCIGNVIQTGRCAQGVFLPGITVCRRVVHFLSQMSVRDWVWFSANQKDAMSPKEGAH